MAGSREQVSPSPRDRDDDTFDAWWQVYPLKVGKRDARKAYTRALKAAPADVLLAGVVRYRDDPNRDTAFTAHPATWLNKGRWDDEPLPARSVRSNDRHAANLALVEEFARAEGDPRQLGWSS